ncbi:MAG: hypothetical protein H7A38_01300 [Chlamydiales bacterium]|nr:hypothetical protein [Chlamydiales bacterium]
MVESLYSEHELLVNKISRKIADDLSKKFQIDFCGMGGGMNKNIKNVSLSFNCRRLLTIQEAREILLGCADQYLEELNASMELRPYFNSHPITARELELTLFISNSDGSDPDSLELCSASIVFGDLYYKKWKSKYSLETILKESFEEAERIVREGK